MGLRQQRSESVDRGTNFCRVRSFCDFTNIYGFTESNCHFVFSCSYSKKFCRYKKFFVKEDNSLTKFFVLILWDITFFRNTVMPPLFLRMKISETGIFCNTERFPYIFFQHCEAKNFSTKKSDMSFFCIKVSGTRCFLKHWRVPHANFFALWDKK